MNWDEDLVKPVHQGKVKGNELLLEEMCFNVQSLTDRCCPNYHNLANAGESSSARLIIVKSKYTETFPYKCAWTMQYIVLHQGKCFIPRISYIFASKILIVRKLAKLRNSTGNQCTLTKKYCYHVYINIQVNQDRDIETLAVHLGRASKVLQQAGEDSGGGRYSEAHIEMSGSHPGRLVSSSPVP